MLPHLCHISGVTPVYSSADESIATVDPATGEITGVKKGSTKIRAKIKGIVYEAAIKVK
ncbi:MAG: Ig-like domain-containing protein [Lachnospiraceae bacterium]|nr:Ig-like domain-containing protein [Lachnospiraceae bacterium]